MSLSKSETEKILTPKNNNRTDVEIYVKHTRWLFFILGLWPFMFYTLTRHKLCLAVVIQIICYITLFFAIIPSFYHMFWYDKSVNVKIALFGPTGVSVACVFKYFAITYHLKNIKECLKQIQKDWEMTTNKNDWEIMVNYAKKGNNVTFFCITVMYGGGVSHQSVAPFLPGSPTTLLRNSSDRPLLYPTSMFDPYFNTQKSPIYETFYLSHILMGVVVCTMMISTCNLGAILVTHICGQIEIIIRRLQNLEKYQSNGENFYHSLSAIIQRHNKVIKLSLYTEQILRQVCLVEVVAATLFICMDEYYCLLAWKNNNQIGLTIYSILLVAFIFNIYIFCHIGELLKQQFGKIGDSIYAINWYNFSQKNSSNLIMMIAISQNPQKITAGGLFELSFKGFSSVLKTSVAYLNILRMMEL
ncbi:GSCOCT00013980001.2-RA-CDS [Cotesia congregata]|uniref:Odorant receptor n=1 Tax=Cotesia congregata TaxID=51543 RepID=A0A8J2HIK1_COTCN|nr:GSCOCT00013980001.2-RA-CDS [Cotesia congregata]CAG5100924.1 olfactory receptor 3 [Cotesia congregata]